MRLRSVLMLSVCFWAACVDGGDQGPGAIRRVAIDGGPPNAAALADVEVEAAPGDTLRIVHMGDADEETRAGSTHSLVAAAAAQVPPLFVSRGEGAMPNPVVWGPCRAPSPTVVRITECSDDQSTPWSGTGYLSTGAMVPGERRDVPLSDDLEAGSYSFRCAFHPELAIAVTVTDSPSERKEPAATDLPSRDPRSSSSRRVTTAAKIGGFLVNGFDPPTTRIEAGDRVTWTTAVRDPRDVVFGVDDLDLSHSTPVDSLPNVPREWDGRGSVWSGFMSTDPSAPGGRAFSLRFGRPGRYAYACRFHPDMRGVVIVTTPR